MDKELFICIPDNRDLRIAHLADIHFGIEGKDWHNDKVERTKKYIDYIIETEKPDLIVCSGDNILATGVKGLNEFIIFMDKYKTPWVFVYGNHDAESYETGYKKNDLNRLLVESNSQYLLYKEGYIETGYENRYGNFSIFVYNNSKSKLLGAILVFDSGAYDYDVKNYQSITDGQISWYADEIDKLAKVYKNQDGNYYEIIPTIVFSHIQLPEFYNAYNKALIKDGVEFIIEQKLNKHEINEIKTGGPQNTNTKLFDVMVEKKSTKAYFVGHAHTLNFQVKMDGIILGFGPQTGFSKLFANNEDPRKTYIYDLSYDFTFRTHCCNEVVDNIKVVN